jgi:hypothetical protein
VLRPRTCLAAAGDVTSIETAVAPGHASGPQLRAGGASGGLGADHRRTAAGRGRDPALVGTASLGQAARRASRLTADDSFVNGLLHDVGKLFLLKLRRARGGGPPSPAEFEAVATAEHADVGATALQLWGAARVVRVAVRWHHDR